MVFTSRPLLVAPDLNKELRVEADASNFATGGVLSIKYEDNKWRLMETSSSVTIVVQIV